jgi:hypothetical protein
VSEQSTAESKILCVCAHCNEHTSDNVALEVNFRELAIFYVCPSCKKMNKMELKPLTKQPYPRAGIMR